MAWTSRQEQEPSRRTRRGRAQRLRSSSFTSDGKPNNRWKQGRRNGVRSHGPTRMRSDHCPNPSGSRRSRHSPRKTISVGAASMRARPVHAASTVDEIATSDWCARPITELAKAMRSTPPTQAERRSAGDRRSDRERRECGRAAKIDMRAQEQGAFSRMLLVPRKSSDESDRRADMRGWWNARPCRQDRSSFREVEAGAAHDRDSRDMRGLDAGRSARVDRFG